MRTKETSRRPCSDVIIIENCFLCVLQPVTVTLVVLLTRTVIRGQDSAIANQGSTARNVKSMTNHLIIISGFLHSVEIAVHYSQVLHIWTMEVVFTRLK